jgi:hypothetical protein
MGRRLSMATRAELLEVVRERYGSARTVERRLILDEFTAVCRATIASMRSGS